MILTIDKFNDPEKIISYQIKNKDGKVTSSGRYFFIFGYRFGLHKESDTCKLKRNKNVYNISFDRGMYV